MSSNLPVIPPKPIAWVCEVFEDANGKTQPLVKRQGMTRDEIIEYFPPANNGTDYNRAALVRAIIYEAYREVEKGATRERTNIRGFWYERFMYVLRTVMGDTASQNSIDVTINNAWGQLIEAGLLTYDDLSLYSEKDDAYHIAVAPDSPYPNVVVLVEKASLFDALKDLADVYEISLTAAGGQASRAAAMTYCRRLRKLGADLDRPFRVFSMADFDPEGWDIPEQFIKHLHTGGITGDIELIRLGVKRSDLGDNIAQLVDVYPIDSVRNKKARQAKRTKWDNWAAKTGGIYATDGLGNNVPGRVELNIYTPKQIRDRIIKGLSEHLDGFAYQVRMLREAVREGHEAAIEQAESEARESVDAVYIPYHEAIEEKAAELEAVAAERTADETAQIKDLQRKIAEIEAKKREKTADLLAQMARLETLRTLLDEQQEEEAEIVWSAARWSVESDDLLRKIEDNGGWQDFAAQLGLSQRLQANDLIAFGQSGEPVTWGMDKQYRVRVFQWARDELDIYWPEPTGPEDAPEAWVTAHLQDNA